MPIRPIRLIDEHDEEEVNKKKEAKREPIQVELKSIVLLLLLVSFFYNALTIYNTQMIKAQEQIQTWDQSLELYALRKCNQSEKKGDSYWQKKCSQFYDYLKEGKKGINWMNLVGEAVQSVTTTFGIPLLGGLIVYRLI